MQYKTFVYINYNCYTQLYICLTKVIMPRSRLNQAWAKGLMSIQDIYSKSSEKFKYLWWIKIHYVGRFCIIWQFSRSWGKPFFPTVFCHFYKEKISFYYYFNPKSIKFCQWPLRLGPAGICDNQALCDSTINKIFVSVVKDDKKISMQTLLNK